MTAPPEQYHLWYYEQAVWTRTNFLGVGCLKSVSDLWNYQEILAELRPALIIEFGTYFGGSALYFATIAGNVCPAFRVLTVDVDHSLVAEAVRQNPNIELLKADTTSDLVADRVRELRGEFPGKAFFIVDSDHRREHVLAELIHLRALTRPGDYVVVEDGNVNGHPVLPDFGEGPYEALAEYFAKYPYDYRRDVEREQKFGFTFAPNGYLVRNDL